MNRLHFGLAAALVITGSWALAAPGCASDLTDTTPGHDQCAAGQCAAGHCATDHCATSRLAERRNAARCCIFSRSAGCRSADSRSAGSRSAAHRRAADHRASFADGPGTAADRRVARSRSSPDGQSAGPPTAGTAGEIHRYQQVEPT
jgi:hypothetical protein